MKSLLTTLLLALFLVVPQAHAQNTTFSRIQFQTGATSAQVTGQVSGLVSAGYVLGASAGQIMSISLNNASLTVVSPSGQPLVSGMVTAEPVRNFSHTLTESGDYLVYVSVPAGSPATPFTMTVSIVGTPDRTGSAERIRFQPGATGAQVVGTVGPGQQNTYLLHAAASQRMTLTLDNGTMTVVSPSGQPLVRGNATASPIRYFSEVLPETGDYRVIVSAPAGGTFATPYTLSVTITGNLSGGNAPQRVRFAAGATGAQLNGQLGAREVDTYVLGALAGQTMTVSSPNTYITLVSPSGVLLQSLQPNALTQSLPESGDYYLQFSTVTEATVPYSASVSITGSASRNTTTERIRFQTGATGAQVVGTVSPAQQNRYVLFAFAGQLMQISLDNATLTVVSPSGQPLVRGEVTATPVRNFSQYLPETGDYQVYVSVPPASAATNYTLTVSITP